MRALFRRKVLPELSDRFYAANTRVRPPTKLLGEPFFVGAGISYLLLAIGFLTRITQVLGSSPGFCVNYRKAITVG